MAGGDAVLFLEGIKGESSRRAVLPSLALLVADLRQRCKGYVLTSVAHGARSPARDAVQGRLRQLGVAERPPSSTPALWFGSLGCITVQAEAPAAGRSKPIPVLLVIADHRDFSHGPIAEQQQIRAAQRHLELPASCRIAMGTADAASSPDHDKWVVLTATGI